MPDSLRILIACPAPAGTRFGNRITALRWRSILRELGHRATISDTVERRLDRFDVLVALHARRSHAQVAVARSDFPDLPIVVAVTGTDLYRDGKASETQSSLLMANAIIVLQPHALDELSSTQRRKAKVIYSR